MDSLRISTGIEGCDEILNGGFIPGSSYLIAGGPGTGKTIFSLQFLIESAKRKVSCLYLTLAEPEETIRRNAAAFGWDLSGITIVDLSQVGREDLTNGEYSVFSPSEVEGQPIWKQIVQALEEYAPERLVIDSVTFLRFLSTDAYQYRRQIQGLINRLSAAKCLSVLLYEPTEMEKDTALALAVDGVLLLGNNLSASRVVEIRTLEVAKLRGSSYMSGRHPLRITNCGITVWPHRIEKLKRYAYERTILKSGVQRLDELLKGGLPSGTCTLISGPAGVGKSSLGIQFMAEEASGKCKGAIYSFEEGLSSMVERCNGLSLPLEDLVEAGSLIFQEINPLEQYPDEFLEMLRQDVEKNGVRIIVIDSLRGYNLAMESFGNITASMQNIVNYCRGKRVSVFLINEQEKITGDLQITEMGVSYLADNVLLIRYAEYLGRIRRLIGCLKKRHGNYEPELREFQLTEQGLLVGERLEQLQGLLTGVPMSIITAPGRETDHEK